MFAQRTHFCLEPLADVYVTWKDTVALPASSSIMLAFKSGLIDKLIRSPLQGTRYNPPAFAEQKDIWAGITFVIFDLEGRQATCRFVV